MVPTSTEWSNYPTSILIDPLYYVGRIWRLEMRSHISISMDPIGTLGRCIHCTKGNGAHSYGCGPVGPTMEGKEGVFPL